MTPKRKRQHNFICDPDGPWGPVYDNSLIEENVVPKFRFIEAGKDFSDDDEAILDVIERIKNAFTQFKDNKN